MGEWGEFLIGVGNVVFAGIAVYNLMVSRVHAQMIADLEKNTNSIKDALIKVTGEAEHARGVLQGKEEADKGSRNAPQS